MRRSTILERLGILSMRSAEARPGHDFTRNLLHVDTDAICPRCFGWIAPRDIVRRTAYGLVQHEACPISAEPTCVSELTS